MMMRLKHLPEYKIYIFPCTDILLPDTSEKNVSVVLNRKLVEGSIHLKMAAYHYLDTLEFRDKWIRDFNYRFLGFLLIEDQIDRIKKIISEKEKNLTIILTKEDLNIPCKEVYIGEGDKRIASKLALFRLKLEKKKLL